MTDDEWREAEVNIRTWRLTSPLTKALTKALGPASGPIGGAGAPPVAEGQGSIFRRLLPQGRFSIG